MMFRSFASSSAGNLYAVEDGRDRILIECGLPFQKLQQALGFRMHDYAACLISHAHLDHARAAHALLRIGMPVWCSQAAAQALNIVEDACMAVNGLTFQVGSFAIRPFAAIHDAPCQGFYIHSPVGNLLYAVDTCYLPHRFAGMTEIAVECNHSRELLRSSSLPDSEKKRIMHTHMSLEVLLDFLGANDLSKVERIHLLHMSESRGDAEGFRRAVIEKTGVPVEVC